GPWACVACTPVAMGPVDARRGGQQKRDIAPESAAGLYQDIFLTLNDQIQKNGLPDSPVAMRSTITEHASGTTCERARGGRSARRGPYFSRFERRRIFILMSISSSVPTGISASALNLSTGSSSSSQVATARPGLPLTSTGACGPAPHGDG